MKAKNARLTVILVLVLAIGAMSGCGKNDSAIKDAATRYMTAWSNQNWEEVLKLSTGDQLAINIQLIPSIKNAKQTFDVKRLEVTDVTTSRDGKIAFASVHLIRAINLPDYGSVMDERTVLLSMVKLNNEWLVFRLDNVYEPKS